MEKIPLRFSRPDVCTDDSSSKAKNRGARFSYILSIQWLHKKPEATFAETNKQIKMSQEKIPLMAADNLFQRDIQELDF